MTVWLAPLRPMALCSSFIGLSLLLGGCGSASGAVSQQAADTAGLHLIHPGYLTVGTDATGPPMESRRNGRYRGADIDLADALSRTLNLHGVKIVDRPFNTLIQALQHRQFDVIISSMNDTAGRREIIYFVDYMRADEAIVVRKNSLIYATSYGWLCGRSVGVYEGSVEWEQLEAASARCHKPILIRASTGNPFKQFFLTRQTEAYTADLTEAVLELKGYPDLRLAGPPIESGENYGIGVAPSNQSLRQALVDAISRIMSTGEYERILDRWGVGNAAY